MGLFSRTRSFFKTKKTFEPQEIVSSHLVNDGSFAMNVNGSITPKIFEWVVPEGKSAWIKRVVIAGVNGGIEMTNFIGVPALANGVTVSVVDADNNLIRNFTSDHTIKTTLTLAAFNSSSIASVIDRVGLLEDSFLFMNDFKINTGEAMFMREGWKFQIIINDDLTDITVLASIIKGVLVDKF